MDHHQTGATGARLIPPPASRCQHGNSLVIIPAIAHSVSKSAGMLPRATKFSGDVHRVPPIRFFTAEEAHLMEAIAAHVLPQDDRLPARRIPIVPRIDERLHKGRIHGYRFAKMPPDGDAYRLGFKAIEQMAKQTYGRMFLKLSWREQDELLLSIHDAKPCGARRRSGKRWKCIATGRCWCRIAWRVITLIRGPGMRSALEDRPILALICAWSAESQNHGRSRNKDMIGRRPSMPFPTRRVPE